MNQPSKVREKIQKKYDPNKLLQAVTAVKNGMKYKEAAKCYKVPYTTLHDKVTAKYNKSRKGPNTALTEEQENRLAKYIIYMAKIGYGLTKKNIQSTVRDVFIKEDEDLKNAGLEPTKIFGHDHTPSMTWVYRFLSRWPELSCRLPENLGYQLISLKLKEIEPCKLF